MDTKQIKKQLDAFTSRVKKKYSPQQIILCGSYAQGTAHKGSDIDILVIADSFQNQNEYERYEELYNMSDDFESDFHVFGYTPDEVKNPQDTFLRKALSQGITLMHT